MSVVDLYDQDVYFDNLKVGITRGNLIEENHYYAYGLKIAAISSIKAGDVNEGTLKNDYSYNGKELIDDADLDWHEYGFRNYDPQIGRFQQLDQLTAAYPFLTPFQYANGDPIANVDLNGLSGEMVVGVLGAADDFFQGSKTVMQTTVFVTAVKAVKTTQSAVSLTNLVLNITSITLSTAVTAVNIINGKIFTVYVGGPMVQSGGPGDGDPGLPGPLFIPIFWEEYWYPAIETIDLEYSNTLDGQARTIRFPEFPGIRFLMFRYEAQKAQQDKNGREAQKANKDVTNPNTKLYELHEVPYKSTKEGGGKSIMRPAPAGQNSGHGASLQVFYRRANLKDGDIFYVPLKEPGQPVQAPVLNPQSKTQPKMTPASAVDPKKVGEAVRNAAATAAALYIAYKVIVWISVPLTEGLTLPLALAP